jgi:hypothetical protein
VHNAAEIGEIFANSEGIMTNLGVSYPEYPPNDLIDNPRDEDSSVRLRKCYGRSPRRLNAVPLFVIVGGR